jgi:excisionase family DNA binding protein
MTKPVTTQEAAVILGRSYDHTRKLIKDAGLAPAQSIGSNKLWNRKDIDRLNKKRSTK